ncbi:hypothetical protein HZ994_02570 [Akkermansiaceae bacterium]|nr:hypothetical protein HZ994_02570 [Akkermansiaceae bacterium]
MNPTQHTNQTLLEGICRREAKPAMNVSTKTSNGVRHTAASPRFSYLLTQQFSLPLLFLPQSGHRLFQRPSPQEQIASNDMI